MAASSVVYILVRLAGAALLVAFAAYKLRVWNPGRNEPREQREGADEAEVVETLVEVEEAAVEAPVAVGSAALSVPGVAVGSPGRRFDAVRDRDSRPGPVDDGPARRPACTSRGGPTGGSSRPPGRTDAPGPTRSSGAS